MILMHFLSVNLIGFSVLSPQTVGVIIRLDRDMFSVLNQHGKVRAWHFVNCNVPTGSFTICFSFQVIQVKHQAVGRRRENKNAVALDSEQVGSFSLGFSVLGLP